MVSDMELVGRMIELVRNAWTDEVQLIFTIKEGLIAKSEIDEIQKTDKLVLKVSKWREKRSVDANRMLWACLGQIASVLRTDKWEVYLLMLKRYGKFTYIVVRESAVEAMKRQWRESEVIGEVVVNGQKGIQMLCYFGSSTYDTQEFSVLLDGVISEMKELGLQPPLPKDVQIAMERYEKEWQRNR